MFVREAVVPDRSRESPLRHCADRAAGILFIAAGASIPRMPASSIRFANKSSATARNCATQ
jgi:hypothetical protein